MSLPGVQDVAFGPFRLSVRQRTLSDRDGPVPLPSRAFDVLVTLIEARASVITKKELIERVWGDISVEENNLHVQISHVRRALGVENRYIVTIPGRGYRFVGELHAPSADSRSFQPAGASDPRDERSNLPAQMTALIGREHDLAATCALFASARLVTLVGPGGVGKTKLALAAARALSRRFEAGCWLVDLGPASDAAQALSAVAAGLKVDERPERSLFESVADALYDGDVLLVLDNCEHLLEATGDLAATLLQRCPGLRILCTSQAPLALDGEHVRRIAPFDLPPSSDPITAQDALGYDAVRLFVERAEAVDGRFEITDATAASVVEICRRLDGIPLAIELAAARAPLLGLEPLLARIADSLALLSDDRRDLPDRHRTLRAAIAWSYGLLPEPQRHILRRLSIFSGGFTLAAAQEVAAGSAFAPWEVVHGLGALVQRSLITTGPDLVRPRHGMLQAMRDFAQEQPGFAEEKPEIARRHADYFVALAEAASGDGGDANGDEASAALAPEIENLRAALGWALSPDGDGALGAALAVATARFWSDTGLLTERRTWLARAAEAPGVEAALRDRLRDLLGPDRSAAAPGDGASSQLRH
jgi:predicted ATPase/DNA-binding winged helix-turn-helix (wHTH) protein